MDFAAHLDGWEELLDDCGAELAGARRALRSMCMGIIPKDLKSEILTEKHLIDAGDLALVAWWRGRVLVLQNKHLAVIAKKLLTSRVARKLNSIKTDVEDDETNDADEAPSWVKHRVAAVKPPPKP